MNFGNTANLCSSYLTGSKKLIDKTCPICWENGKEDVIQNNKIVTRCHHFFCRKCIDPWIKSNLNPTCPSCRNNITKDYAKEFTVNLVKTHLKTGNNLEDDFSTYDQELLVSVLIAYVLKNLININSEIFSQELLIKIITALSLSSKSIALLQSCEENIIKLVLLLINCGIDLNVTDHNDSTPLHIAILHKNLEITEILIHNDANLFILDKNGSPLKYLMLMMTSKFKIIEILVKFEKNLNLKDKKGNTPLISAITSKYFSVAISLIENGADISIPNADGESPLICAILKNAVDVIGTLISKGVNVNFLFPGKIAPLFYAIMINSHDVVNLLIESRADLDIKDLSGNTPLVYAIQNSDYEMVKLIIDKNAQIDSKDRFECSPLSYAIENMKTDIIDLLMLKSANINILQSGEVPLITSIQWKRVKSISFLVKNGADLNVEDIKGCTPMKAAIINSDINLVKFLIENELLINGTKEEKIKLSPLYLAIKHGELEIAQLLIAKGADLTILQDGNFPTFALIVCDGPKTISLLGRLGVNNLNMKDRFGNTLMISAINYGSFKSVELLIEKGVDVNSPNCFGDVALTCAVTNNSLNIINLIIEARADLNIKDFSGNTPFTTAIKCSSVEIVKLFIAKGAKINIEDTEKFTESPLYHAITNNKLVMAQLIIANGADLTLLKDGNFPMFSSIMRKDAFGFTNLLAELGINLNIKDRLGYTLLFASIINDQIDVAEFLIEKGVDLNLSGKFKISPLGAAISKNQMKIVKLLVENGANVNPVSLFVANPLAAAIKNGNFDMIEFLRESGAREVSSVFIRSRCNSNK